MKWDVIVDTAGRRPLRQLRRALTPKGTLVVVGGDGGGRWTGGFFRGMLRGPLVSPFVGQKLMGLNSKVTQGDLQGVAELAEAGKLRPVIGHTYTLSETPEAIRELETGHAAGKLVIAV
jgi:NADPH:quinone reductase-like Zn-dependent oxidoreductase